MSILRASKIFLFVVLGLSTECMVASQGPTVVVPKRTSVPRIPLAPATKRFHPRSRDALFQKGKIGSSNDGDYIIHDQNIHDLGDFIIDEKKQS